VGIMCGCDRGEEKMQCKLDNHSVTHKVVAQVVEYSEYKHRCNMDK